MNSDTINIAVYIGGLILVIALARIFSRPLKFILRLLISSAAGLALIAIINTFAAQTGLVIGINPVTAAVCAVLGLPGAALLALIKMFI